MDESMQVEVSLRGVNDEFARFASSKGLHQMVSRHAFCLDGNRRFRGKSEWLREAWSSGLAAFVEFHLGEDPPLRVRGGVDGWDS